MRDVEVTLLERIKTAQEIATIMLEEPKDNHISSHERSLVYGSFEEVAFLIKKLEGMRNESEASDEFKQVALSHLPDLRDMALKHREWMIQHSIICEDPFIAQGGLEALNSEAKEFSTFDNSEAYVNQVTAIVQTYTTQIKQLKEKLDKEVELFLSSIPKENPRQTEQQKIVEAISAAYANKQWSAMKDYTACLLTHFYSDNDWSPTHLEFIYLHVFACFNNNEKMECIQFARNVFETYLNYCSTKLGKHQNPPQFSFDRPTPHWYMAETLYALAQAYYDLEQYKEAIDVFQHLIAHLQKEKSGNAQLARQLLASLCQKSFQLALPERKQYLIDNEQTRIPEHVLLQFRLCLFNARTDNEFLYFNLCEYAPLSDADRETNKFLDLYYRRDLLNNANKSSQEAKNEEASSYSCKMWKEHALEETEPAIDNASANKTL